MIERRGAWPWVLLLLSVIYLAVEFAFNATLLQSASGLEVDPDSLHRTELFGRSVSGAGFALLLLGWLVKWDFRLDTRARRAFAIGLIGVGLVPFVLDTSAHYLMLAVIATAGAVLLLLTSGARPRPALAVIGLVLFAWTAMFAGQKLLIEHYLIGPSSWDERLTAQYMQLLKAGLARNLVRIEEAPLDPERLDAPEERTFIALVGALVMQTPEFLERVKAQEDDLVHRVAASLKQEDLSERYAAYRDEGERFQELWVRYRASSAEFIERRDGAEAEARQEYARLLNRLGEGWGEYQRGVDRFAESMQPKAEKLSRELTEYFQRRGRCKNQSCAESLDRNYATRSKRFLGKDVPWTFWCDERSARVDEAVEDGLNTIINAPFAALGQLLGGSGTGYQPPGRYRCNTGVPQVRARLMVVYEEDFRRKANGYPLGIRTEAAFIAHSHTAERVRGEMRRMELASTWQVSDPGAFVSATARNIRAEANRRWNANVRELAGGPVPAGLNYTELIQHTTIQSRIAEAMGDAYVKGMTFEYSEKEFKAKVIDVQSARAIADYLHQLRHEAKAFANGEPRAEEGRQYLRAVLIPPISLSLSLFFALLTSAKSGVMLLGLVAVPLVSPNPMLRRGVTVRMWTVVLVLLVAVPLQVPNKFADARAFQYFSDAARKTSPALTAIAEWTVRMQPLIYPVGEPLATRTKPVIDWVASLAPGEVGAPADASPDPQVRNLLARAEAAFAADRLLTPEADAAFTHLRRVLELDPDNAAARAGLERIVTRYETLANAAGSDAERATVYRTRAAQVRTYRAGLD